MYVNTRQTYKLHDIKKSVIKPPVVGEYYQFFPEGNEHEFPDLIFKIDYRYKIHNWYEKRSRKFLKSWGWAMKEVVIETKRDAKTISTHAWKITSGIDNFKQAPLISFASHDEFKDDVESLEKLEIAASKFGLNSHKLNIVNDWIIDEGTKHSAYYDKTGHEISLSSPSLSLLAHEAAHFFIDNNLINDKEYRSNGCRGANASLLRTRN